MSVYDGVEFSGWDQFRRELRALGDDLKEDAADVVGRTLTNCADDVRSQYPEFDTGKLKAGVKVQKDSPLSGRVRTTAPHAHLFELGTVERFTHAKGSRRGRMPIGGRLGHPVFIPTAIKYRARMQEECIDVLRRPRRTSFGAGSLL